MTATAFGLIITTGYQGYNWLMQRRLLSQQAQDIETKLNDEQYRTKQLLEYREYMKTDSYIEDIAGSELGMVYDGETIFKDGN